MCFLSKALLLLVSLSWSAAAPTPEECVDLEKTLSAEELHTIFGKWIMIETYSNHEFFRATLENASSSQAEFVPSDNNQTLTVTLKQANMMDDRCVRYSMNFTVSENKIQVTAGNYSATADFLKTCADCLVMRYHTTSVTGRKGTFLIVYGKTNKLPETELEKIRKQAKCLGFQKPPQFVYDVKSEFCPEKTETTEVKEAEQ